MDFSLPALPPNVTPLTDGDPLQVGRYRLIGRLGADAMGTLFAGVSPDHEPTALMIAGTEWASESGVSGEAVPARLFGGVCAVGVRDSGTHEGRPWSAIAYAPGLGLQQHVRVHGRLSGNALLVLAAGIAEALAAMHAAGTVHGDMRPGNVVASADGPKVLDFGITARIDGAAPVQSAKSLGWLAPERYEGTDASRASDVHGWACLVVLAATGEPPFGTSPAGHTPGRIPGQILWEMARRAREARVDLRALPRELRPLLERAFSPDPAQRPSAEDAYLECLLMLGIDEQATAETWPEELRALIGQHWPVPDLSWHDPARWTDAALALEQERARTGSGGAGTREVPVAPGGQDADADTGPGAAANDGWGPESAAEAYGHPPARLSGGQNGPVPGLSSSGRTGAAQDQGAAAYLFGPAQTGEQDLSAMGDGLDPEDEESTGRGSRLGVWLGVGALGMAAALGGGYLLFDSLKESPADTVVAEEPTADPDGTGAEDDEDPGDAATPGAPDCDDAERLGGQQAHAPWRPFNPEAASPDVYAALLTPGPEGQPNTNPDAWPFVSPLDHDTVDFGLVSTGLEAFPVVSVCMTGVRDTGSGVEFTAELTYHPNVGSHPVYAEDFLTLTPLDPQTSGGSDREVLRGGSGSEFSVPLTTLVVLDPENPSAEVTVQVQDAPGRAGVAYRPAAYSSALAGDVSGHCYDVDGTLEWRDQDRLGSEFFALPGGAPGESDMTQCPVGEGDGN
ncbi:serine/threonine protein kinase [Nocardiopsis terrae]